MEEITRTWIEEVMDEALIPNFTIVEQKYRFEVTVGRSLMDTKIKAIARYKPFSGLRVQDGVIVLTFDK